jgi:ribosomal protein S18 acetylase RimI-like enzyme
MVHVRRAQYGGSEDDADLCRTLMREYAAHLNASVGGEHICVTTLEKELAALPGPYAEPAGAVLLAFVDDEPAGCVALKPVQTEANAAGEAEMKRLWVRPAHQGRGLGRQLAEAALDLARQRGYSAIVLDTLPRTMQSAYALYRAMGFDLMRGSHQPAAHRPIDVAEMIYMRKDLK